VSERIKVFFVSVFLVFVFGLGSLLFTGCRTGQPMVIDTGDFERVRHEFEHLRGEHAVLQQAYRELAESSQFFIDFHRQATGRIESGLGELSELGAGSLTEIARLRELAGILGSVVQVIIDAGAGTGAGEYRPPY